MLIFLKFSQANSISLKKYEAIKIIFIRVDSLTRKTFGLETILGRGLIDISKNYNPVTACFWSMY